MHYCRDITTKIFTKYTDMLQDRSRNRGFTWLYSAGGRSRERSRYRVNMLWRYLPAADPTWHDITWHDVTWHDMSESSVASHAVCYSWNVQCPCTECIGTKVYVLRWRSKPSATRQPQSRDRSLATKHCIDIKNILYHVNPTLGTNCMRLAYFDMFLRIFVFVLKLYY